MVSFLGAGHGDNTLKEFFLTSLYHLLDDGMPRFFVPEVNSGDDDLASIVNDLIKAGFTF